MKQGRNLLAFWALSIATVLMYQNCGGGFNAVSLSSINASSSGGGGSTTTVVQPAAYYTGRNQFPVQVTGTCSMDGYNGPCVTVTVCTPGTTSCVSIPNVLLDTGSTGLRLYKSLLGGLSFNQVTAPSGSPLGECYEYGDGTYGFWGSVQRADVMLGSETASNVPIQIVDPSFGVKPSSCAVGSLDTPTDAGINGIIGVNQFVQDCGSDCVSSTQYDLYYSCTLSSCTGSTVPLTNQVPNPVSMMPFDNNGLIITLPAVSLSGGNSVTGTVTMGIGTQTNNSTSAVTTTVTTDDGGFFGSTFNGKTYSYALVDSGTPSWDIPSTTTLVDCSDAAPYFCPTTTLTLSATMVNVSNVAKSPVSFSVANADNLSANYVTFNDIGWDNGGTSDSTSTYIWGLPFFFGRSVFVGFEGKSSSLASGAYIAY